MRAQLKYYSNNKMSPKLLVKITIPLTYLFNIVKRKALVITIL